MNEILQPQDETLSSLEKDFGNIGSPKGSQIIAVNIHQLLEKEFKPREIILGPWLTTQSLSMIFAARGVGKTHVSLGIAYAIASGETFLNWHADKPRGVLFLDGEMPGHTLKERLARIITASEKEATAPLLFVTPDLQEFGMPDLSTSEGQAQIDSLITEEIELIIVDNLSCLARSGRENEAESWLPLQDWALRLRSQGKSVLFIHHSGKGGLQRGTSRREDVLDTVIHLKNPSDYQPEDGAFFEVHFVKARHLYGEAVMPITAKLSEDSQGKQQWLVQSLEQTSYEKVVGLAKEGLDQKSIAIELNLSKSSVSRHCKRAKNEQRI